MPCPMKPTQFTVFTKASASALKMLHSVNSIIALFLSVIPARTHVDRRVRTWTRIIQNLAHSRLGDAVQHADFLNQPPRTKPMDQEFRLLAPLTVHVVDVVSPVSLINHVPVHFVQPVQIIIPIREGCDAVPV